jgi:NAD+ synthase
MTYLYYFANKLKLLVCGTSDKSEIMMGYFTKWGDGAADISPIADLFKTQVRKFGAYLGVPEEIIKKPSSPTLWPGQFAEVELGIKYSTLDLILFGLEHFMNPADIASQLGLSKVVVDEVRSKWLRAEHKRVNVLTLKNSYRTVGMDFRLSRRYSEEG